MRFLQNILPCIALTLCVGAQAAPISGPLVFGGHTYYLLAEDTWASSQAQAVALGGNLATINSLEEQLALFNAFNAFGGVSSHLWIGLNDATNEGNFAWVSGETATFTHWGGGEPNAYYEDEDYVMMLSSAYGNTGRWVDTRDMTHPFGSTLGAVRGIVEINGVVPEPATLPLVALAGLAALGMRRRRG